MDEREPIPESARNERVPMIRVRVLGSSDIPQVLRINIASRPAVAGLDEKEIARLLALQNHHFVALNGDNRVVGYALAFSRDAAYDGEEFLVFRAAISERGLAPKVAAKVSPVPGTVVYLFGEVNGRCG